MITLTITADGDGWLLSSEALAEGSRRFASGGRAERTARRLARFLARSGRDARVVIRLRSGALAGVTLLAARTPEMVFAAG